MQSSKVVCTAQLIMTCLEYFIKVRELDKIKITKPHITKLLIYSNKSRLKIQHFYVHIELSRGHINSIPSYFKCSTKVSGINTVPSVVNAVMYVAVLPWCSIVFRATITSSSVPGINLNEEKPYSGCRFVIWKWRQFPAITKRYADSWHANVTLNGLIIWEGTARHCVVSTLIESRLNRISLL